MLSVALMAWKGKGSDGGSWKGTGWGPRRWADQAKGWWADNAKGWWSNNDWNSKGAGKSTNDAVQSLVNMMTWKAQQEEEEREKAKKAQEQEDLRLSREAEAKERKGELEAIRELFKRSEERNATLIKSATRRGAGDGDEDEGGRPGKRSRGALAEVEDDEEDWRAAIQPRPKAAKVRPQRARVPIDGKKWSAWVSTEEHARKIKQELSLQAGVGDLTGKSILDIADMAAEEMSKNSLEALHLNIVGSDTVARWNKVDICAAIVAHVVVKP